MNSLFSTKASPTLHFCDLDGENDREIYTNADIAFENPRSAVIVDGKICGYFCGSFPSLGLDSALVLAEIDLETGEITALDDPSWFVTSSETTPEETTSSETEPPETEEEFVAPIPDGGLDFIEHVGEVPEEFKEIVENDTFGDLREIEGRLYYTDQKDGFHYIVFVDNRGRETAVKTTKASRFNKLFLDSEGNYLAEYITGVNNASILVKFDSNGNVIFDLYCDAPVSSSLEYMVEADGGYVFVGEMSVKSGIGNLTVTDVVISKISYDGKLENHNVFGGNDYDTVKRVEKTSEGVSVYFYMRNREDRVTSSLQRYDFDTNCNLVSQNEVKESDVPSVNNPSFTVDGKPYYKIADFFKDYDWDSSLNTNVIEYDDCVLLVYTRFTSNWRHSTHGMLSSLPPIFFYRERVYAAYTKDGELIWRTAFDATDYNMLKEYYGE